MHIRCPIDLLAQWTKWTTSVPNKLSVERKKKMSLLSNLNVRGSSCALASMCTKWAKQMTSVVLIEDKRTKPTAYFEKKNKQTKKTKQTTTKNDEELQLTRVVKKYAEATCLLGHLLWQTWSSFSCVALQSLRTWRFMRTAKPLLINASALKLLH